jgi:hypothetical protein
MANRTYNLRGRHFQGAPPGAIVAAYPEGSSQAADSGAVDASGDVVLDLVDDTRYDLKVVVRKVVTITVDATAGNWTVSVDGVATANNLFNISAANLATAIAGLSTVGAGNVTVTGGPGDAGGTTPYVVTFTEDLAGENPLVTVADVDLTGGGDLVTAVVTTQPVRGTDIFLKVRSTDPAGPASAHPIARRAAGAYNPGV